MLSHHFAVTMIKRESQSQAPPIGACDRLRASKIKKACRNKDFLREGSSKWKQREGHLSEGLQEQPSQEGCYAWKTKTLVL
jgi:hypothetical protein